MRHDIPMSTMLLADFNYGRMYTNKYCNYLFYVFSCKLKYKRYLNNN